MANPEDLASPIVTTPQIRDFSRRILMPLAVRLSVGDAAWVTVSAEWEKKLEDGVRQRVEFEAERDIDSGDTTFGIYTCVSQPIDDEWDGGSAIMSSLRAASATYYDTGDPGEGEGALLEPGDTESEAGEADGEAPPIGYWGVDTSYEIRVPFSYRVVHRAIKGSSITIYDEDYDPLSGEKITDIRDIPKLDMVDLERLVRFGEIMLMQEDAEAQLTSITEHDMAVILGMLQSTGLVSKACKVFSAGATRKPRQKQ